jgi:hypothetical protein
VIAELNKHTFGINTPKGMYYKDLFLPLTSRDSATYLQCASIISKRTENENNGQGFKNCMSMSA